MSKKIILQGEEAMKLWRQGKDDWNNWVEQNPEADVSFKGMDFSKEPLTIVRSHHKGLCFGEFCFPKGDVNFSSTKFGKGAVNFFKADFGEGSVDFSEANFGEGLVNFSKAKFGRGEVDFSKAKFGRGEVDFLGVQFNEGNIIFYETEFGEGNVFFYEAEFGEGNVYFSYAKFGEGNVYFGGAEFGKGEVDFSFTKFSKGDVDFLGVQFGEGDVNFYSAQLSEGTVNFSLAMFGKHACFSSLDIHDEIKSINFRYAIFNGSFEFSTQSAISIIPDFVGTKTTNHTSLSGLKYNLKRDRYHLFSKAVNENDGDSLCRLKEIAESNKDHAAALGFHADEMRAKRWQKERMGTAASLLDWLFDVFSLYGQSIWRPMAGLLLTISTSLLYTVGFFFPLFTPSVVA